MSSYNCFQHLDEFVARFNDSASMPSAKTDYNHPRMQIIDLLIRDAGIIAKRVFVGYRECSLVK